MWNLGSDIRLALRRQNRARGFTATVVLTLALGIGCATAVLTVANAVLLRKLPLANQDRLVVLDGRSLDRGVEHTPLTLESALGFARETNTLSAVATLNFEGAAPVTIVENEHVTRLQRSLVSGNYFSVLGAEPQLGRALRPEDDARGAQPVVVLSNRAWRTHFGSAPDIVGKRITTREDGITAIIVGVMPVGVDYPKGVDAWTPVRMAVPPENMAFVAFNAIGRLAPSATAEQARNALTAHFQREGAPPAERNLQGQAIPITDLILGNTQPAVIVFLTASGLLLLITCLNVANLLLVRGLTRGRDVAVRLALGASRARIVKEVVVEHALLAMIGGILGAGVAVFAVRIFVVAAPVGLPRLDEIQVNVGVFVSAMLLAVVVTLLSAITPAIWTARTDARLVSGAASAVISGGSAKHTGNRASQLAREVLVGGQVALALLVLSAAGLLGRSLWKLERVDLAFNPSQLAVAELAIPPGQQYGSADAQSALYARLQTGLEAMPGVQSVSPVVTVPYAEVSGWKGRPTVEGQSLNDVATNAFVDFEVVAPSFFRTLDLPLLKGRTFDDGDRAGAPLVAVLSASAARHYWPGADAIGKRLQLGSRNAPREFTVVGVVPDPRYRDLRAPRATMYFPIRQSFFPFAPTTLVLHTTRNTGDVSAAIRTVLAASDPNVALVGVSAFEALMSGPLAQPRMNALLLAVFAAAAMGLSAIGLFGILATTVRQRTREFGIRIALGATAANVVHLVLGRGLTVAICGIGVGLLGAIAANRFLASLLYNVNPLDVWTLSAVVIVVLLVAGVAAVIPARSIARIHPATALRE